MTLSIPDFWDLWKAISIGLTGLFGVMGLLTTYKDKETGRMTGWGKVNLAGIILSATMGVLAQLVDIQRKTVSAQDSAARAAASAAVANTTAGKATQAATNTEQLLRDMLAVAQRTERIARATDRSVTNSQAAALASQRAATASLGIAQDTSRTVATSRTTLDRIERLVSPLTGPQLRLGIYSRCDKNRLGICDLPDAKNIGIVRVTIAADPGKVYLPRLNKGDIDFYGNAEIVVRSATGHVTPGTYQIVVPLEVEANAGRVTSYLDLAGKTLLLRLQSPYLEWDQVHTVTLHTQDGQFLTIPLDRASPIAGMDAGYTLRYTFPRTGDPRLLPE